jgi:hypothetical protein
VAAWEFVAFFPTTTSDCEQDGPQAQAHLLETIPSLALVEEA